MTNEQAQQVLDEMQGLRPEQLKGESQKLFEAIMLIADERDELKKELKQKDKQIERYQNMLATNDMLHIKECQEKDEVIDLMANDIDNFQIERNRYFKDKEEVKQYFGNKAKELLKK